MNFGNVIVNNIDQNVGYCLSEKKNRRMPAVKRSNSTTQESFHQSQRKYNKYINFSWGKFLRNS